VHIERAAAVVTLVDLPGQLSLAVFPADSLGQPRRHKVQVQDAQNLARNLQQRRIGRQAGRNGPPLADGGVLGILQALGKVPRQVRGKVCPQRDIRPAPGLLILGGQRPVGSRPSRSTTPTVRDRSSFSRSPVRTSALYVKARWRPSASSRATSSGFSFKRSRAFASHAAMFSGVTGS